MPRLPRSVFPAAGDWHVTARGVDGCAIYRDDEDRRDFLVRVWTVVRELDWHMHALCLMTTHYHLVLRCTRIALSRGIQRVNGGYAAGFNTRHARRGHLFGDRFALWQVRDEEHLAAACAYVVGNPVRAGICEAPGDWSWSWSRYR